jgi:CheY-like chemotaxis protein/tetratricopeptide (TPR) repeat protein
MPSRILLADDNERLSGMLRSFLESLGHQVETAADGSAAYAALEARGCDLLVLDLKMPLMSGVELLQKVRKSPALRELPVVIMTGVYRGEGYAKAAAKLGVKGYLEKPFSKDAFLNAVSAAIAAPPAVSSVPPAAPAALHLADLLTDLYLGRKSGTVTLTGGRVTFLQGEPVSFSSTGFIPYLSASGRLTAADLERYPQPAAARLQLTESGLMTYDELVEQSRRFLARMLGEAISRGEQGSFAAGEINTELPLTPLSLPRLMYQLSREHAPFPQEGFLKRYGALYPATTSQYYRLANLLSLGREEIELLELIANGEPIAAIVGRHPQPARASSFLQFLIRMKMVAVAGSPAPAKGADFPQKRLFNRPMEEAGESAPETMNFDDLVHEVSDSVELVVGKEGMAAPLSASEINFEQDVQRDYAAIQDKNYYEIFSLTQSNFSFATLKEAYFAKTREYSPEKFMELSGATLARAQDVLSHYANAYNTLSNVVAKERYDEMLNANTVGVGGKKDDQLQAQIQFQSGKVFLEMEDFANAEKALQDAYTLDPEEALTSAYLAWSIYKNPANSGSHAAVERCRLLLSKSLQMGKCAEAFAFRGWMLLDEGRDGLAEGEFQKALRLNARERHALAGLRLLAERREADKKGLFRRIFR